MQILNKRLVALEGGRPYPLRFHVEEAGADAKLIQHGPLGIAYHCRYPICTMPVAKIIAHATVHGDLVSYLLKVVMAILPKSYLIKTAQLN
jgi:hypothetical protein